MPKNTKQHIKKTSVPDKNAGAETEGFIIGNSNNNGINPNPTESGHTGTWDEAIKDNRTYKEDAQNNETGQ